MAIKQKTYGNLYFDTLAKQWVIDKAEPHICIKLKAIFTKIGSGKTTPFKLDNLPETRFDLLWFIDRYPLEISPKDLKKLKLGKKQYQSFVNELEQILLPNYVPSNVQLKPGKKARNYQLSGKDVYMKARRLLIADDVGLGKTLIALISFLEKATLPAMVVVETHMPAQWKEKIQEFTHLTCHLIKGTTPYNLPTADVYITKYSLLSGWVDLYNKHFFKSAVFDEIQNLRIEKSDKYIAGKKLSESVDYCLGLTASPVYNYGIEIFNIIDLIKPGGLGKRTDFEREWLGGFGNKKVKNPAALGSYLREKFLLLRRTRSEVGRELPAVNTIVHTVSFDYKEAEKVESLALQLAIKGTTGTFTERGSALRELDIMVRQSTGVAKARGSAEFIKLLLESGEAVIVAAWHREVWDILNECLTDYKPLMYTGSETPVQKEKAKQSFINKETNCLFLSLRSGAGIDGLQYRCPIFVFVELDWSPEVHRQLIGRGARDRNDDILNNITAFFLVTDEGSDPPMMEVLGLKASQAKGIIDPLQPVEEKYSDESRLQHLAQHYLKLKSKPHDSK